MTSNYLTPALKLLYSSCQLEAFTSKIFSFLLALNLSISFLNAPLISSNMPTISEERLPPNLGI